MTTRLLFIIVLATGCSARALDGPLRDGFLPGFGPGSDGGAGGAGGNGSGGEGGSGGGMPGPGQPGGPPAPSPARLIGPASTTNVTSQRPRLRWDPTKTAGAATVELCADRACSRALGSATVEPSGAAARPDQALPAGVVFWRVHTGKQVSATWEFFVGKRDAPVDSSWGSTLDVDGDGIPDVAAAAGSSVAVYRGGVKGLGGAATILPSPDGDGAGFGYVITAAGDVNGDGYGDLAVGECGTSYAFVHLYLGGANGPATTPSQTLSAPDAQTGFGCRVAGAGDLDGDGYADLAVARIGPDFSGGLYIFAGNASGVATTTTRLDSPNRNPSRLGYALAAVGDVDGDGYDDLLASELEYSDLSGQVHLYHGGKGGISNSAVDNIASPDPSGLQFGGTIAGAGDVDGDGHPDFLVGAAAVPGYPVTATAHLYRGGGSVSGGGIAFVSDGAAGFAFEVEGGRDLDGDGYSDVIVSQRDSLDVFLGSAGGPAARGTLVMATGQGANPRHLSLCGDVDGDGAADVIVSDGAGAELLFGGTGGIGRGRVMVLPLPSGASAFAGAVR
jgi:hypothetical protein